jgi:hypothetical protein
MVCLSGYYAWRQIQTLRRLRQVHNLPPIERQYQHRQAWRRLFGCGLMLVFAVLLLGSFALEEPTRILIEQRQAAQQDGEPPELTPEQKSIARLFGGYWIVLLLLLLALLVTAAIDLLATRRFGMRQFRQLQADRRAMIERQAARLRGQRNGFG